MTLTTRGSAQWASLKDIDQAGLLRGHGVILGQIDAGYLRASGDAHTLLVGASRSGKDVNTVIPTLLSWPYSVLVLDIKGESFDITANYRFFFDVDGQPHGQVYRVNFAQTGGHRVNLWDFIRYGTIHDIDDADALAEALAAPTQRGDERTEYWRGEAIDVLSTVLLYQGQQTQYPQNGAGALALMSQPLPTVLKAMRGCSDPAVVQGAQRLINLPKNHRAQSWGAGARLLRTWRSPLVAHNTATMDVPFLQIQHGHEPVSVYLQVTAEDLSGRLRRLFRVHMAMILGRLMDRPVNDYQQPLLIILNEVAAMGNLPVIRKSVALVAGYGIQMLLVLQSLEQLWDAYGKHSGIEGNCPVKVVFAQGEAESARVFSDMLGEATVQETSARVGRRRFYPFWQHRGQQTTLVGRELLKPDELRRLDPSRGIVLADGVAPVLMNKIRYYRDPNWMSRVA